MSVSTTAAAQPPQEGTKTQHFAALSIEKVVHELKSSSTGLLPEDAEQRLTTYGRNELPEVPATPWWRLFLEQFDDGLVKVLLGAAAISLVMAIIEQETREFVEPLVIVMILILNAGVGVWQEGRAEDAIEALKAFVPKTATVIRHGVSSALPAELLVPGDVIEVHSGNRVPADCRVLAISSTILSSDRSVLNGESNEVLNQVDPVNHEHDREAAGERFPPNMIFSGTAIVHGSATAMVVATGSKTEIGVIERDVREQEETKTPLQVKLDEFGDLLTKAIGLICLLVFALHLLRHFYLDPPHVRDDATWFDRYVHPFIYCLKVSVALAVAAIPEGLPAVVTTCLALGTRRMATHNALVRELPAVESLGRCTVICSDKTGTLTTNLMSVARLFTISGATPTPSLQSYAVDDSRLNIVPNAVRCETTGERVTPTSISDRALQMLVNVGSLCTEAKLWYNERTQQNERMGEATEAAIRVVAEKIASTNPSDPEHVRKERLAQWRKNATLEFSRDRKLMSTHCTNVAHHSNEHVLFVKGAPESVIARSTKVLLADGKQIAMTPVIRKTIEEEVLRMSSDPHALRCIALAFRPVPPADKLPLKDAKQFGSIECDLIFAGIVGMLDPPRPEVPLAVEQCRTAGIRVVVITGDNKSTAEAICRKIGVFAMDESCAGKSFTGDQFDALSLEEKRQAVLHARLFSRTTPSHKLKIVELLQQHKLICAMTGDGVNDAPALKKADIGLAMGSGTEVAKAASKMILADDNFASIVSAVREGRAIYNNTQQFIRYLISSNIGEVVCIFLTGVLGIPDALLPVQLLWVNLVTDGLPAMALGFNEPDPDIMDQAPRRTDEAIVNGFMFLRYVIVGTYVGAATVGGFVWWFLLNGYSFAEIVSRSLIRSSGTVSCALLPATAAASVAADCAPLIDPFRARGVALSILVVVEMFNALNALSENQSLVVVRPTRNPKLLLAIASSLFLHFVIMYTPWLASIFSIAPLDVVGAGGTEFFSFVLPNAFWEWKLVLVFSIPVIFVDEALKFVARRTAKRSTSVRKLQ